MKSKKARRRSMASLQVIDILPVLQRSLAKAADDERMNVAKRIK
jgi:hypothetical protein